MSYYSDMTLTRAETPVRDRLLVAGAQLMEASGGPEVSTRAICEAAGVQAPTLYHHFGSKDGLLEEVVSHGFRQFLSQGGDPSSDPQDPIEEIRQGWDRHVQFGLQHPAFYAYIYGRVERGKRCGVVDEVQAMLLHALEPAARQGRLTISPSDAAAQILAASSGVILALITDPADEPDLALSLRVRDAILESVTSRRTGRDSKTAAVSTTSAAIALASTLDEAPPPSLSVAELALLRVWLDRLAESW
jgi:AcrR family transcriptional regulator